MTKSLRIIICTAQVPFVRGGAELLVEGLRDALRARGHSVDIVSLPYRWQPHQHLLDSILGSEKTTDIDGMWAEVAFVHAKVDAIEPRPTVVKNAIETQKRPCTRLTIDSKRRSIHHGTDIAFQIRMLLPLRRDTRGEPPGLMRSWVIAMRKAMDGAHLPCI